ncbi:unnamed protein product [Paramecium sonneborni]|uniref:Uncharacterized protein n=1 Tax=Paramecium sonneborni TaxID=65129 RepID=A0A8S1PDI8_9CILI|nr:unnamed protein product [Paramecium sonneborni]
MQKTPEKQELSQALLLSISQYSWDKQIRLTTDEDVLCSYSKFSNDQGSYCETKKDQGNVFMKKCNQVQIDEVSGQEHKQLLLILREKDKRIEELEHYQVWLQEQNEKLKLNQQMMIEDQSMNQQQRDSASKRHLQKIDDLELQISQSEQQYHKSLKSLGQLEKENSTLKTKIFEYEQKLFQQQHQQKVFEQINEQQKLKFEEQDQINQSKIFELQQYIQSQESYINKLQHDVQMSRKNSKENISKQYKSVVLREKSPQLNQYDQHQMNKFVECIVDMVMNCTLSQAQAKPSLKECWKWLKNILEEYMILKKQILQDTNKTHSTKSSQFVGKEINGERKRDHSFFNDLNRRFQTSVEDSENKYLRSNTLLSRVQK